MTIEEKAAALYGRTEIPEFGVWLLRGGVLLNGSHEGHQRDVDHAEISQFFKPSKRQAPGGIYIYLLKFMRRGNIRWSVSDCGACVDMVGMPDAAQFRVVRDAMLHAERRGADTSVAYRTPAAAGRPVYRTWPEWLRFADRYAKDPELRKEILKCRRMYE